MDGQYWKADRTMSTNEWLLTSLTFDSFLNLDIGDDTNTKFLLLRVQTTYMTYKMRGDCWGTWLIIYGSRWPRVCRHSTSVLYRIEVSFIIFNHCMEINLSNVSANFSLDPFALQLCHYIKNHLQLNCLFNSMFRLAAEKHQNCYWSCGNPKRDSAMESISSAWHILFGRNACLTHWGRDKMAVISQMTFSWMAMR